VLVLELECAARGLVFCGVRAHGPCPGPCASLGARFLLPLRQVLGENVRVRPGDGTPWTHRAEPAGQLPRMSSLAAFSAGAAADAARGPPAALCLTTAGADTEAARCISCVLCAPPRACDRCCGYAHPCCALRNPSGILAFGGEAYCGTCRAAFMACHGTPHRSGVRGGARVQPCRPSAPCMRQASALAAAPRPEPPVTSVGRSAGR
jgi:hypothetical protein